MDAMGAAIGGISTRSQHPPVFPTAAPGRPLSVRLSNFDLGNLRVEVSGPKLLAGGGCPLGSLKFIFGRKKSQKTTRKYSYIFGLKMVPSKFFREVSEFLTRNENLSTKKNIFQVNLLPVLFLRVGCKCQLLVSPFC